ncbi:cadmium-translocating P-type ATPase [Mitsuaria sp. WAJ17]|uniref:heavy metal translocating P-type ATPase n=1 Tax=Mitsuaria sp. WAJ17 TaxID=2761452 RepID=UPI001602ADCB|nr:cation-translocating P-type ATPase [Mitsuaria sp. WAJ17]MBB2485449.1 cadmium-translocating P-type ATPase [Mitsuaria sp. WAJ17]
MSAMPIAAALPSPEGAAASAPLAPAAACDDAAQLDRYTEWLDHGGRRLGRSQLQLAGMHCAACAGIIERALMAQPGVQEAHVNSAAERLQLTWDPARTQVSRLIAAIERTGYGAVPDLAAPARQLREKEHRQALWRLFVASFLMMQVMMLATPIYVAGPGDMAPDQRNLLQWGEWVLSLPVMLFSAGPFFSAAWRQIRNRSLGMDVPVALGLLVTFVASSGAVFDPAGLFGHEVYFDSLTMFVSFLLGGRYLELRARHKVARSLELAGERLPELVQRLQPDGQYQTVGLSELRVGDRVRVLVGQAFPGDGVLIEGVTAADESLLSGESLPVGKASGDEVVAGSLNLQAPVLMSLRGLGADTRYESIVRLMRSALTQRPAQLRLADRAAGPFLWGVLVLAAGAAVAWSWIDPSRAVWVAVSVLIVTCPCALSLAAPSAWLAATGLLARRGVLLSRLDLLETMAQVDTVVMDKTGTLTEDRMRLGKTWPQAPDAEVLQMLQALAGQSLHPYAKAALEAWAPMAGSAVLHELREHRGQGMEALDVQGRRWRLGAAGWAAPARVELPSAQLLLSCNGEVRLALQFEETLRPDAVDAVQSLRSLGLRVELLSGDRPERVEAVALAAGIAQATGGASPEGKLARVETLQAEGRKVLMLGDGVNDAPVLARADASVAMGQGALIARTQADAVLLSGRLSELARMRALALRTRRVIRQNLAWSALYNAACIPLALAGWLPPWAAGIGMASSSLLVILNALRLARDSKT